MWSSNRLVRVLFALLVIWSLWIGLTLVTNDRRDGLVMARIKRNLSASAVVSGRVLANESVVDFSPRSKRFVMAASYWEKMTMGTTNLYSLLKFAREWEAEVPLPFMSGPWLNGWPAQETTDVSYSVIYNTTKMQRMLLEYNLTRLVDFNQFYKIALEPSKRKKIFHIHIRYFRKPISNHIARTNCHSIRHFLKQAFKNRSITCCKIEAGIPTTPNDIATKCGFKGLDEFVVIFHEWHGITQPNPKRLFRLFVPKKYFNEYKPPPMILPHSQYVIQNATHFLLNKLGISRRGFIAVHIRAEKLYLKRHQTNDTQCMLDTINLAKTLAQANPDTAKILYFTDNFGLWYYKRLLDKENVEITRFNSSEINNEGFAAQVEKRIMSEAKLLVVSGGGSFQETIIHRYTMINRAPLVFRVKQCMVNYI